MANPTTGMGTFKKEGTDLKNKAQDAASEVADKTKDTAATVADRAKEVASNVVSSAGNLASNVGHKAEDATSAVGGGMQSLAETIRDKGPHGGMAGSASGAVASTLENSGRYLQEQGLSGIGEDVTNLIRRNPIPALLIGVGIGFLIARATIPRR